MSILKQPKYNIQVQLSGADGNAYNLLAIVRRALKRANVPQAEVDEFMAEATSSDYDHLLQTCMRWVSVS